MWPSVIRLTFLGLLLIMVQISVLFWLVLKTKEATWKKSFVNHKASINDIQNTLTAWSICQKWPGYIIDLIYHLEDIYCNSTLNRASWQMYFPWTLYSVRAFQDSQMGNSTYRLFLRVLPSIWYAEFPFDDSADTSVWKCPLPILRGSLFSPIMSSTREEHGRLCSALHSVNF